MFYKKDNGLVRKFDGETLLIEPWGKDSFRIRASYQNFPDELGALLPVKNQEAKIDISDEEAVITHGNINATVLRNGQVTIRNAEGDVILQETRHTYQLKYGGRELIPHPGSNDYKLTLRLESDPNEKIFGMGQYQHDFLNLKGLLIEMTHRNSQVSVPFYMSDKGYGMLWNNPAVGRASFGLNVTEFSAQSTKKLDYWITAGKTPRDIEENYLNVTGRAPMMPDYALGFWQSKLRYRNQEELLAVAHKYKELDVPLSVIVIDFFHWPHQGDWCFDKDYWPDPEKMVKELNDMGIEVMVSVWPTVQPDSVNYHEMVEKGYLIKTDRGVRTQFQFLGQTELFDATNPDARKFLWKTLKENYYKYGIKTFWLDEAEPEFTVYDHDIYRNHLGPSLQYGNIYPLYYSKTFYDGQIEEKQENIINLVRAAWAGSQRYGALVWSGDIPSTFESLGYQIRAGLNMAIAGIPWWTTDIGGFHGGNPDDKDFQELMIRWLQYATFCPVMRIHGDRSPAQAPVSDSGGGLCHSGADNEVWSYGDEAFVIFKDFIKLREKLEPYIREMMKETHEVGTPPMRPLFYDFPDDKVCWNTDDQFMFGDSLLLAPILELGSRERDVYLPEGTEWKNYWTGEVFTGGQMLTVDTPLEQIPVFINVAKPIDSLLIEK